MNVGKAWSFACKKYSQEKREQSSTNNKKYLALDVEGTWLGPPIDQWEWDQGC